MSFKFRLALSRERFTRSNEACTHPFITIPLVVLSSIDFVAAIKRDRPAPLERRQNEIEAGSSDWNPAARVTSIESKGSRSEGNRRTLLHPHPIPLPPIYLLSSLNFSFSLRSFLVASYSGDYPATVFALSLILTGIFYFVTAIIVQPPSLLSRITLRRCARCIRNNDIQLTICWITVDYWCVNDR